MADLPRSDLICDEIDHRVPSALGLEGNSQVERTAKVANLVMSQTRD